MKYEVPKPKKRCTSVIPFKFRTKILADKIGAEPEQIYFTSGATAANNIAILGVAYKNPKCHLITSKIEHKLDNTSLRSVAL